VEVFSAQEKSPLAHWNVAGIKKVNFVGALLLFAVLW